MEPKNKSALLVLLCELLERQLMLKKEYAMLTPAELGNMDERFYQEMKKRLEYVDIQIRFVERMVKQ